MFDNCVSDLMVGVFLRMTGTPGQSIADEEELHVVEGKGGKLDVRVVSPPVGVGLQRHAETTVVRQVLPQGEVAVHLCVGYRVLVILIPQTAGLAVEGLDSFVVVELG